jgi:glycosyltransferase involved in cell wall biosynthesis
MSTPQSQPQVGYVLRSYPRLSQTFILHEILALEQLGLSLQIFAITNPHEPVAQAQVAEVRAPVQYLEDVTRRSRAIILREHLRTALASPRRYAATLRYLLRNKVIDTAYTASSRFECFHQAVYLARQLRRPDNTIGHLHAHFAHDPALIALLTHMLTGISFSFTAHARDLFQIPRQSLIERIAAASAVLTCCGANLAYFDEVVPTALRAKVRLIHHGVNLEGFQPRTENGHPQGQPRTEDLQDESGSPFSPALSLVEAVPDSAPLILSVGRLVAKKGFPDLLRACALLKQSGQRFRCAIYGDGPLRAELAALIDELGLAGDVALPGECSQRELIPIFQQADIFALTPFVTEDGDRDGIPNVLVEAMACGLPPVSTAVSGIPELIQHEYNGLLAQPRDIAELAAQLGRLLADAQERNRLGAAARRTVVEHFDLHAAARQIAELFEQAAQAHTHAGTSYYLQSAD